MICFGLLCFALLRSNYGPIETNKMCQTKKRQLSNLFKSVGKSRWIWNIPIVFDKCDSIARCCAYLPQASFPLYKNSTLYQPNRIICAHIHQMCTFNSHFLYDSRRQVDSKRRNFTSSLLIHLAINEGKKIMCFSVRSKRSGKKVIHKKVFDLNSQSSTDLFREH